jgi:hypothetical protein
MVSKDPEMSKQDTVGKRNYVSLMISQQLEIIGFGSRESQREVMTLLDHQLSII